MWAYIHKYQVDTLCLKDCLVIKTCVKGFTYSSRQIDTSYLRDCLVITKLTLVLKRLPSHQEADTSCLHICLVIKKLTPHS